MEETDKKQELMKKLFPKLTPEQIEKINAKRQENQQKLKNFVEKIKARREELKKLREEKAKNEAEKPAEEQK